MKPGDRIRSKNTMFWRADPHVTAARSDKRWIQFHRACGDCGLFFDDIDPINDNPTKDVPARVRGGYHAIAFRADRDQRGFFIQRFVSRGTGAGPLEAVLDAYRAAQAAGDSVEPGLERIFDDAVETLPPAPVIDQGIAAIIGLDVESLIG